MARQALEGFEQKVEAQSVGILRGLESVALISLALVLAAQGKSHEAHACCHRALKLLKGFDRVNRLSMPEWLERSFKLLELQGRNEEAKEAYQRWKEHEEQMKLEE